MASDRRLFTNLQKRQGVSLQDALGRGDWRGTKELLQEESGSLIEAVLHSGLRGRGGAGFLTGKKWSMVAQASSGPRYLVVNADESEPGSCKDRDILHYEPHKVLEGALIAAVAIGATKGFVYIRGEYGEEAAILERALEEAYTEGFLGHRILGTEHSFDLILHNGAGAYMCGEETALLESLEGRRGMPRLKPPYPSSVGLYGAPTLINNVETLAAVPTILRRGPEWFASLGVPGSTGTRVFSISGHVNTPCNVEAELGIPLKDLINTHAGGVQGGWENLLAVIPGGVSVPLLPKALCEQACMDYDSLSRMGTALGTGSVIVMNRSTDIVEAIVRSAKFYMDESCGQCSPCREGTGWIWRLLKSVQVGEGRAGDGDLLQSVATQMSGRTICALADAAAWPVMGLMRHFRAEVEERLQSPSVLLSPVSSAVDQERWAW